MHTVVAVDDRGQAQVPPRGGYLPRRVMVGAAGTATAFGIVRTLRANWDGAVEIVVADVRPRRLIGAAAFADEYLQSPSVADDDYADWLEAALHETGVALYVPLIDEDIAIAAEIAERRPLRTRIAAPPLESARICWDKLDTHAWLKGQGLPAPATWAPAEAPHLDGGLVAKSRNGQGSIGFRKLASVEELEALEAEQGLVVQVMCEPPEVTIDAYLAQDGTTFRAICRERIEVKAGVCTKARVFESAELSELAERIARGLGLTGCCIQVMKGPEGGGWCVTDVNARPGAGARLSGAAGVDVLGAVYADLLELPFDSERALRGLEHDVYAVRQFDEYVI
jgi:carbamoyl-phosphate synthase large subunit